MTTIKIGTEKPGARVRPGKPNLVTSSVVKELQTIFPSLYAGKEAPVGVAQLGKAEIIPSPLPDMLRKLTDIRADLRDQDAPSSVMLAINDLIVAVASQR